MIFKLYFLFFMEDNKEQYIYLIQEREFIKCKEPIYKIGKTKQQCLKRILNYPNGTSLIIQIKCSDCDKYEKMLINKFKEEFIHMKEIGNEYFKGNENKMIELIYGLIWELDIKVKENEKECNEMNKCSKCNKELSSKYYLEKHLLICKGVSNTLECHLCHKIFAHSSSKSKHLKTCKEKNKLSNENKNNQRLKNEHIDLDFIYNENENEVLTIYTKKILENPENRYIKKTNINSNISIVVMDNEILYYNDNEIYPKFIRDICNSLKELLISKIKDDEIIKKHIEYLDHMINQEKNKDLKKQIQKTKLMVYNVSNN